MQAPSLLVGPLCARRVCVKTRSRVHALEPPQAPRLHLAVSRALGRKDETARHDRNRMAFCQSRPELRRGLPEVVEIPSQSCSIRHRSRRNTSTPSELGRTSWEEPPPTGVDPPATQDVFVPSHRGLAQKLTHKKPTLANFRPRPADPSEISHYSPPTPRFGPAWAT